MNPTAANDHTVNKVAVCSAIFAGFAYVGYSVAKNAFGRRLGRKSDDGESRLGGGLCSRPLYNVHHVSVPIRLPARGSPSVLPAAVADHADRRPARQLGQCGHQSRVPQAYDRPAEDQRAKLARQNVCRHHDGHTDAFQQTFPERTKEFTGNPSYIILSTFSLINGFHIMLQCACYFFLNKDCA